MTHGIEDFEERRNRYHEAIKLLPHRMHLQTLVWSAETNRVSMSLEAFESLATIFEDSILYGLKHPDNGNSQVFSLNKTPYSDASDIAEKSGCLLMQKIETDWIEA